VNEQVNVLIVDDEEIIRDSLAEWLVSCGYKVYTASNGKEGIEVLKKIPVRIVLADLIMPVMDGISFIKEAKRSFPTISIVIITAHASIETAITAMREGACDYIEKPFCPEAIELIVSNLAQHQSLIEENMRLKRILHEKSRLEDLVYKSKAMQDIADKIRAVAPSNATVLITGESGTGKELVAKALHNLSPRKDRSFVPVACTALPETLLESELFGHEKGAYTGAESKRKGRFEIADSGTIFLDEIGDISEKTQLSLLRVIETKQFSRIGGNALLNSDVRIITATNRSLPELVQAGRFRTDLYYRLNVVNINLPPLRERREDIPLLAKHFMDMFASEQNKPEIEGFAPEAIKTLMEWNYPGNVRELENIIENAVLLTRNTIISDEDLPKQPDLSSEISIERTDNLSLKELERRHILKILESTGGNRSKAAKILGIERATLYNKLKTYGIM